MNEYEIEALRLYSEMDTLKIALGIALAAVLGLIFSNFWYIRLMMRKQADNAETVKAIDNNTSADQEEATAIIRLSNKVHDLVQAMAEFMEQLPRTLESALRFQFEKWLVEFIDITAEERAHRDGYRLPFPPDDDPRWHDMILKPRIADHPIVIWNDPIWRNAKLYQITQAFSVRLIEGHARYWYPVIKPATEHERAVRGWVSNAHVILEKPVQSESKEDSQ